MGKNLSIEVLLFDFRVRTEAQMCACDPHALFVSQICEIIQILCPYNMTISSSNTIRETIIRRSSEEAACFFN